MPFILETSIVNYVQGYHAFRVQKQSEDQELVGEINMDDYF